MTSLVARIGCAWVGFVLTASLVGCGSGSETQPVKGRVVFKDGRPFTEGTVEFEPANASKGPNARGRIQPDGTFTLTTFREHDGAIEGEHRAVVVWSLPAGAYADEKKQPPPPIHPRFRDYAQSGLRLTVVRGNNEFTITVEKPLRSP